MYYVIIFTLIHLFPSSISKEIIKGNSTIEENWRSSYYNEGKNSNGENNTFVNLHLDGNDTNSNSSEVDVVTELSTNSSMNGIQESCFNNRGYSSAERCITDCKSQNEMFLQEANNITMAYKALHLKLDEFNITKDNSIFIPAWNITVADNSYYVNPDGTIKVCLPLYENLLTCEAASVKSSYVQPQNNGHSMYLGILDKMYKWNEFYFENGEMVICYPNEVKTHSIISTVNTVGSVLSAICLWVGVLLCKFIPNLCKNHLLQCHLIMLASGFLVQSCLYTVKNLSPTECLIIHAFLLFFFLSSFFWINLHAYDLYQAMKTLNTTRKLSKCVLIWYSVIGWGLPLVIVVLAVVAEELNIPGIQPGYKTYCHFDYSSFIAFLYYHGWMALSIFINVTLFLLIVWTFHKISRDLSLVNRNAQKQLFLVSVKLAIVMGFSWIFEVLSWAKVGGQGNFVIAVLDVLVCFQGVFIFLVYICRRKILKKLCDKLKGIHRITTSSSSLKSSSSKSSIIQLRSMSKPQCSNDEILTTSYINPVCHI